MMSEYGPGGKKKKGRKKRIVRSLTVNEISGVDKAAQVPAEALLMKRAPEDSEEAIAKFGFETPRLTTPTAGHSHLLDDNGQGSETTWSHATGAESGHVHPWVRQLDGNIVIGEAEGHTHDLLADPDISSATKSAGLPSGGQVQHGDEPMTDHNNDAAKEAEIKKSIQDLTERAQRAESILKLNHDTRAYFDQLEEEAQSEFLVKSVGDQASIIEEAQKADKVVYKSAAGEVYRATDDARLVAMAKRADEESEKTRVATEAVEASVLSKRAGEELNNCPGTLAVRGSILKALTGVEGSEEFLKAANEAMSGAFASEGTSDGTVLKAEDQLEELSKKYAEENSVTIEKARATVLESPEGSALYLELEA